MPRLAPDANGFPIPFKHPLYRPERYQARNFSLDPLARCELGTIMVPAEKVGRAAEDGLFFGREVEGAGL